MDQDGLLATLRIDFGNTIVCLLQTQNTCAVVVLLFLSVRNVDSRQGLNHMNSTIAFNCWPVL